MKPATASIRFTTSSWPALVLTAKPRALRCAWVTLDRSNAGCTLGEAMDQAAQWAGGLRNGHGEPRDTLTA